MHVKASWVEDHKSKNVIWWSTWIMIVKHVHVPSILHSCPFSFLQKVICSNQSCGYPPKRSHVSHIVLSFVLSLCYRFGGLCRLPSSGFMNMYMYNHTISYDRFYSYPFLSQLCIFVRVLRRRPILKSEVIKGYSLSKALERRRSIQSVRSKALASFLRP